MRTYQHKIKPSADAIRERLKNVPAPGVIELTFAPGAWRPSARFFDYCGVKTSRAYSVRNYKGRMFVFRLH